MNNDFARMRCPICGTTTAARINKNGIIYTYCPNGHHARLSRDDSREATAALKAGKQWNNGIVYIYPEKQQQTERKQENERKDNSTGTNGTTTATNGTTGRNNAGDNYGRTNGQFAADSTVDGTSDTESDTDFGFGFV